MMNLFRVLLGRFRNIRRRRRDSNSVQYNLDSVTLLQHSDDEHDLNTDHDMTMLPKRNQRLIRRNYLSLICRIIFVIFVILPLFLYASLAFTPVRYAQSLIPMKLQQTRSFMVVVAHPDDECLFFSPTILGMLADRVKTGVIGNIVVFSIGNSTGIGPMRKQELQGSCKALGVASDRCICLDVPDLQDNSDRWWPKEEVAKIVKEYVKKFGVDTLITFDDGGVSGHVNHRSVSLGIEHYVRTDKEAPLSYQLTSVPLWSKFIGILNLLPTIFTFIPRLIRSVFSTVLPFLFSPPNDERALFVSSLAGYFTARTAFHAHQSQVLWFRRLYTAFSRYMIINDLQKIRINS